MKPDSPNSVKEFIDVLLLGANYGDAHLIGELLSEDKRNTYELTCLNPIDPSTIETSKNPFDIIITLMLEGSNDDFSNFQILRRAFSDTPIIVLTGSRDPTLGETAIRNGADDFIEKVKISGASLIKSIQYARVRNQYRENLKKSEQRFEVLIEKNSDGIIVVNKAGIVRYLNPAAENLLGLTKDDMLGQLFDFPVAGENSTEVTIVRKGAAGIAVDMRIVETVWADECVFICSLRDISERKKAEKAVLQASENWNKTFHSMYNGIALLDIDQKIIQSNRAFQDFVNSGEENLYNQHCYHFVHGTDCPVDECPFESMKGSKSRESREMTINGKFCEVIVDPILDEDGEISGAVHIINDVTRRKYDENVNQILHDIAKSSPSIHTIEDLLIVVRKKLSEIIDTTNFLVALYDPQTDVLKRVKSEDDRDHFIEWKSLNSLSGHVITTCQTLLITNRDECSRLMEENRIELNGPQPASWVGVPIIYNKKALGVVTVKSYTHENAFNQSDARLLEIIARELAIVMERSNMIKDLVTAKEKAEESDRLKSAFLANMSHEIRTPMNGILGFTELLKDPDLTGEEQEKYIGIIEKSGDRLINVIDDIVSLSKIESGQMPVIFSEIRLNEQIDQLFKKFRPQAESKNIRFLVTKKLQANDNILVTDTAKVMAILTSLLKNAIKFTFKGSIELGMGKKEHFMEFFVKDTGIGIPPEHRPIIFERFRQVDQSNTRKFEGAGLGLAIAKGYVEMLGGKIWVESEPGEGSTFYFTIPYSGRILNVETTGGGDPQKN